MHLTVANDAKHLQAPPHGDYPGTGVTPGSIMLCPARMKNYSSCASGGLDCRPIRSLRAATLLHFIDARRTVQPLHD
jgi:hypothetical protein